MLPLRRRGVMARTGAALFGQGQDCRRRQGLRAPSAIDPSVAAQL